MFNEKDKLLRRCLTELSWMIDDEKWRADMNKTGNSGSDCDYKPELKRAIELREELEQYFRQGSDDGRRQDA